MRKIYQPFIYLSLMAGVFCSCTKDFTTINTDPNTAANALPESFLAPALYEAVVSGQNRAKSLTNELMQVYVPTSGTEGVHRYIIMPKQSNYIWDSYYGILNDFRYMHESASNIGDKNFMAIAWILDSWVMSTLTDAFGDVPDTEATKGRDGVFQPAFDRQEDIYKRIFVRLDSANMWLGEGTAMSDEQKALDPMYQGDIAKWRKFGNSLYLRLLMRVAGRSDEAVQKFREICSNASTWPVFTSNADAAILRMTTTPPLVSAFYNLRPGDFSSGSYSEFFIETLLYWGDPRLEIWATQASLGVYAGIQSGYVPGPVPDVHSSYHASLQNAPLLGNILNYAELKFIQAEGAIRNYISADQAEALYDTAVVNSIRLWEVAVPESYLERPGVKWENSISKEQKIAKIITQKYFSTFFTDFQEWNDYRRTGYPDLTPYTGAGVQNGGKMPSRFKYPVYVQGLNQKNYNHAVEAMGGDDINVKVWWNNGN